MRGRVAWGLAGMLMVAGCAGAMALPSSGAPASADPAPAPAGSTLEHQIHDLVNRRRTARGLPPLRWDARLADIAREHSRAMAAGRLPFGHERFEERAAAIGRILPVRTMAENVAYDSRTGTELARHVVEGWISSSGHRQNIQGEFTLTGIGAAEGRDGVKYFTQIFVATQ